MTLDAQLNYYVEMSGKPSVFIYKPSEQEKTRMPRYGLRDVVIHEGREHLSKLSLDEQGFVLTHHETGVGDLYDEGEVKRDYYPEMEALVARVTGASRVVAFDHNVRCAEMAKRGVNNAQMPVLSPHNDYTDRSGPQRVRDLMGDEAESLLEGRFAVINVWKPIRGPVESSPLAMCDAASIGEDELVATDLVYRDRTGEVQLLRYSPEQRWYYFSRMESNEALLMKCFDSERDGRARFTAHTAFEDPSSGPDAPARESIEVRTLAFFSA
ncbi:MAG: methyltransferase [Deltaproteobacteria bacterium]|nr:methyltransferase [Deltaproteobacteria bacterium]MBW2390787.1 methyltransferase [Deltaproteobacteria bacterium]MBW2724375.1 methyltransferase [Deltaproteobacteria bacterium]